MFTHIQKMTIMTVLLETITDDRTVTDPNLRIAIDKVSFWRAKVSRRFHKNAKKVATWNLWAAEDKAQHMAQAVRDHNVHAFTGPNPIDFDLPVYRGSQADPEIEE